MARKIEFHPGQSPAGGELLIDEGINVPLTTDNASQQLGEECRIGTHNGIARFGLRKPQGLEFLDDGIEVRLGQVHLVQALYGCDAGSAARASLFRLVFGSLCALALELPGYVQ